MMKPALLAMAAAAVFLLPSCKREKRETRANPVATEQPRQLSMSSNFAGLAQPPQTPSAGKQYEESAYHVSQGKRFYVWFNCNGCHANGGGDSGPPLMDDKWIYGGEIQNIYATIQQGRPNGMPSFRGRIPDEQIWQISAYVRSMGRNVRMDIAPGRNDDMHPRAAENHQPLSPPVDGGSIPPSAQQPQ
ncbi:MAG TPA: c-type cytochrome [Roseomonas sp.]|jgi:cytochrome c oxidase cbb3-type subunit 3